jgi:hypothetical protein
VCYKDLASHLSCLDLQRSAYDRSWAEVATVLLTVSLATPPSDSSLFDHVHMPRARTAAMGVAFRKAEPQSLRIGHASLSRVRCAPYDLNRAISMTSSPTSPKLPSPTTPRPTIARFADRGEDGYYVRIQGNVLVVSLRPVSRPSVSQSRVFSRRQRRSSRQ